MHDPCPDSSCLTATHTSCTGSHDREMLNTRHSRSSVCTPCSACCEATPCLCDAGALVQSVEQDDRLDSAVVSFLVIAQQHIMAILTPPTADSPQPLTLTLLQARNDHTLLCGCCCIACSRSPITITCHVCVIGVAPSTSVTCNVCCLCCSQCHMGSVDLDSALSI